MQGSKNRKLKNKPRLSEHSIQRHLYVHTRRSDKVLWAHNIYLFNYESDFIAIDKSGTIYEYEIKLTKSDFTRDFKKPKHKAFQRLVSNTAQKKNFFPNYFYFVCPVGVIHPIDVPPYAGLIYVYSDGSCKSVKRAQLLHKNKRGLNKVVLLKIAQSLSIRYYGI